MSMNLLLDYSLTQVRSKRLAMAAMLAEDQDAEEQAHDGWDELEVASRASTAVTGMSAYARTDDATSIASTSGRPASTLGGKRPARKPRKVIVTSNEPAGPTKLLQYGRLLRYPPQLSPFQSGIGLFSRQDSFVSVVMTSDHVMGRDHMCMPEEAKACLFNACQTTSRRSSFKCRHQQHS